jgi:hypothetical protein
MTLPPSPAVRPELAYRISGQGRETFTRAQIRDAIRAGEVTPHTELAYENSEDYRPASQFPELTRYLALITQPAAAAKPGVPRTSAFSRILPGLIYPWTGFGWIVILAATLLQPLPFGAVVAGLFTTVYGLAVIRESSQGSTRMPALRSVGGPVEFVMMLLKLVVVGLVSAWPIFLAIPLMFVIRSASLMFVAVFVMFLYFPAAVATLAKWKSIQYAIRPSQIFSFIRILGADYVLAVLAPLFTFGVAFGGALAARALLGPSPSELVAGLLTTWGTFYSFHLLGWGIHHHGDEF